MKITVLIHGSPGRTIVVRKKVIGDKPTYLYINDLPIGTYKMSAKLVGGGALKLRPYSPRAESATASHGNWDEIAVDMQRF